MYIKFGVSETQCLTFSRETGCSDLSMQIHFYLRDFEDKFITVKTRATDLKMHPHPLALESLRYCKAYLNFYVSFLWPKEALLSVFLLASFNLTIAWHHIGFKLPRIWCTQFVILNEPVVNTEERYLLFAHKKTRA